MAKKVLIIEDDDLIRNNTAEILNLAGYEALTAVNGKEGVNLALELTPDLILCDITMPVMDGFEVIYLLSKNPSTAGIPFIFLTAKSEKTDMRKGMRLGADDYIVKPFEEMDLLSSIEIRMKKSELFNRKYSNNIEGLQQFLSSAKGLEELKKLSSDRKVRRVKPKEVIYLEEDKANNIYFINKGAVKTFTMTKEGKELITGLYKSGDFIGPLDLLESELYRETAMATESGELIAIPKNDFFALIYSHRDVAVRFIHLLSNNINELKDRLLDTAYGSLRKRMANTLLSLLKKNGESGPLLISRENLAYIAGITIESVSRTLHEFKEEDLIEFRNKDIIILNAEKLATLKN